MQWSPFAEELSQQSTGSGRIGNAEVARQGGWVSSLLVYHAGNALHGHSIRSLLLLGLQPAARGVFESSSYGMAARLLFASSFDGIPSKHRRVDLLAWFGRIRPERRSTVLR